MKAWQATLVLPWLVAPALGQLNSLKIVEGLGIVTDIRMAPGDAERIFVGSSRKGIHIVKDDAIQPELFLDLTPILNTQNAQGLLSLAFHPDYPTNGRFYVVYIDMNLDNWLVEYTVSSDPDFADPGSARPILGPCSQPSPQHNWNQAMFGPDGMLYLATGDGGPPDDLGNTGPQDLDSLLGKVLRLDVDAPPPHIPADNPFVGVPGAREEIWVYGLRQPWRIAFDRLTGDAYIADVGNVTWEEIDFVAADSPGGQNFGWRCMEGNLCTGNHQCVPCVDPSWVPPIYEYEHTSDAHCLVGGYVYRGGELPELEGAYLFGDNAVARFWALRYDGTNVTEVTDLTDELAPPTTSHLTTFGLGNEGELFWGNAEGELWQIARQCLTTSYCTANANSAETVATISSEGSTRIATNDFALQVSGAVPSALGLFYYGTAQIEAPFGDGIQCVGGLTFRLAPPVMTDPTGSACRPVDLLNPPEVAGQITAGSEWFFQFWYRDEGSAAGAFNLSDGISAVFCP